MTIHTLTPEQAKAEGFRQVTGCYFEDEKQMLFSTLSNFTLDNIEVCTVLGTEERYGKMTPGRQIWRKQSPTKKQTP